MDDPQSSSQLIFSLMFIFVLLMLSALFSGSETAFTSMGRGKLKDYLENEEDEKKKSMLQKFMNSPNQYLTTILILNNVVNILASSLTTLFVANLLPNSKGVAVGIATGFMTLMILIFGEITPKVYARENKEKFFKFSFRIVNVLNYILTPVVWILVNLSNVVIKIFGGKGFGQTPPFVTESEIMTYLDMGHEEGVIEKYEKYLMQRSLEIRETSVKEIMTPRVEMVSLEDDEKINDLIKIINDDGYSRIPIYRESLDTIVGICYAKDIFKLMDEVSDSDKLRNMSVLKISHKPFFVPITMKVKDILKMFLTNHTHMAIVVDEYGGTAGLVTLEDVIEELTGEILDEYDDIIEESNITRIDENIILVNGSTPINDIERELDIDFPETDFETIGGFLLEQLERFPKPGEHIIFENYEFEVISVTVNKIDKVKIIVVPDVNIKGDENDRDDDSETL
ncbi:CBS domain containing-hemolysin-like protein [Oceanotoga teriensis]|uniref:CBS domain containing-hemolysin-like protein n=2 Tax=Petrotogaceae TaxID=1643949 RepID=A0AA45C7H2_9BACT|nr:CBS domain containing-hemolysin-like protein [Oceanotoga teriensis]